MPVLLVYCILAILSCLSSVPFGQLLSGGLYHGGFAGVSPHICLDLTSTCAQDPITGHRKIKVQICLETRCKMHFQWQSLTLCQAMTHYLQRQLPGWD